MDCTQTANTEFYIDHGKEYDIYTGAEFRIKLNDTPASFFNIYLFQSRGAEYASAPANQRYIGSNVQLKTYVDATIIGEWQYVQVPFTAFSSNGEYVNENNVKVKDTSGNLAKVCAIGFAHMMTDAAWYFAAHAKNTTGAGLTVDCGNMIQLYPIIPD